jgi:hypothetical protein
MTISTSAPIWVRERAIGARGRRQVCRLVALTCAVAVIGTSLLALSGSASATPAVTFKAAFVPIAGDRGPNSGSGALLQLEYGISGSEYDYAEAPPPLIGLNLILPEGIELHPEEFPACPAETLENEHFGPRAGTIACSQESRAGPVGGALIAFSLGSEPEREHVRQNIAVEPYFAPGGGLELYLTGGPPFSLSEVASGRYANLAGRGGEGPEIITQLPLTAPVSGAPDLSLERIDLTIGAELAASGRTTSYVTLPNTCPRAGLPVKTELIFAGLGGLAQTTVTRESKEPCPAGSEASAPAEETSVPGTDGSVTAPSNHVCLSRRDFTIHVRQIKNLIYRRVSVEVNGRHVAVVRRGSRTSADVDLRGLPKGRYVVRITVTTSTGRRIAGTRAYHTCAPKPLPGGHHPL